MPVLVSQAFVNVYDVGRTTNLRVFFNAGQDMRHSWWSVLSLRRIEPYGDGWHWPKRLGMGGRSVGPPPSQTPSFLFFFPARHQPVFVGVNADVRCVPQQA